MAYSFCIVQVLYYGFVDIIDSICGLEFNPFAFKAELYKVLKEIQIQQSQYSKI